MQLRPDKTIFGRKHVMVVRVAGPGGVEKSYVAFIGVHLFDFLKATSENPELCVTLHEMLIYLSVNSAFVSVASLDFGIFGGCL